MVADGKEVDIETSQEEVIGVLGKTITDRFYQHSQTMSS